MTTREYKVNPPRVPDLDWLAMKRWRRRDELAQAFGVSEKSIKRYAMILGWETAGTMVSILDVCRHFHPEFADQLLEFWRKRAGI